MTNDSPTPRKETKSAILRRLLSRKSGADLPALQHATGWQAHSVRAALSTLRKDGFVIERLPAKNANAPTAYRITTKPGDA